MEFDSTPEQKAQFADDGGLLANANQTRGYFVVGTTKFIVMSLCTLSIYELYWIYKNWKYIKAREQSKIMPFWRAFFAGLWNFSLAQKIKDHGQEVSVNAEFNPSAIGAAYIGISILSRLPAPFFLLSFLSFLPLLTLQTTASRINQVQEANGNEYYKFTTGNYVVMFFGGLILFLAVLGSFIPE